jgi:hypothetical protein
MRGSIFGFSLAALPKLRMRGGTISAGSHRLGQIAAAPPANIGAKCMIDG